MYEITKIQKIKIAIRKILPKPLLFFYRFLRHPKDIVASIAFLFTDIPKAPFAKRLFIIRQLYLISYFVHCPHRQHEILQFIETILSLPNKMKGSVVEAGSYKGGSTAKFSIAAKMAGRKLIVFDSFKGIPGHNEPHDKNIFGGPVFFPKGLYSGTLQEVKRNIRRFGELEACEFVKGWFKDTMPKHKKSIAAIYLDVDLASSTRTCIKYLYPLLVPGGVMYSQDCHLSLVIKVFNDDKFWENEVGHPKPYIEGLGKKKLIKIVKPAKSKDR